jgi:hypothetical protein
MLTKADAASTITLLECEGYSLFVFRSHIAMFIYMINGEWKGRRVCQHVCDGPANCIDEEKTQVGCCTEYQMSPSLANVHHFIPPALVAPTPTRSETDSVFPVFVYEHRPIESKHIEMRIVVNDVD